MSAFHELPPALGGEEVEVKACRACPPPTPPGWATVGRREPSAGWKRLAVADMVSSEIERSWPEARIGRGQARERPGRGRER